MGKRKVSLKRKYPNRGEKIKHKKDSRGMRAYHNRNGNITVLNHLKHMLFEIPYKHEEYNKDMLRFSNQMFNQEMKNQEKE
jgi:hypothetical protein